MSYKTQIIPAALAAFFVASCGSADYSPEAKRSVMADSMVAQTSAPFANEKQEETEQVGNDKNLRLEFGDSIAKTVTTTAAGITALDSSHRFIRTADVRCRVNEVSGSTYVIEDAVRDLGGYVSDTKLGSHQNWEREIPVSEDSAQKITKYSVYNQMTIRVPAKNLDSLLRAIAPLVQYMDYRNVNVNDITLDQISKKLEQRRLGLYNATLQSHVVDQSNKPDKIMNAAENMLSKQEMSDASYIESLKLEDKVLYATLNLELYQPERTSTSMILIEKPVEPFDPGMGSRIADAFQAGLKGFGYILSGIVLLWPLWLIAGAVWVILRWQLRKKQKPA